MAAALRTSRPPPPPPALTQRRSPLASGWGRDRGGAQPHSARVGAAGGRHWLSLPPVCDGAGRGRGGDGPGSAGRAGVGAAPGGRSPLAGTAVTPRRGGPAARAPAGLRCCSVARAAAAGGLGLGTRGLRSDIGARTAPSGCRRHGAGQRGEPVRGVPEPRLPGSEQALGPAHRQQDLAGDPDPAEAAAAPLPRAGRPRHLLRVQVRGSGRGGGARAGTLPPPTVSPRRLCHQLDFSTSGALCVALNKAAAGSAYRCFKERRVTKAYLALVRGHVQERRVTISHAIGRNSTEGRAHTMCIEGTQGCENPKPSLTELVVLEHGSYGGDPVSKVLLKPLTGRTHQLRVHCSALGHPIVGDLTYGLASGREDQPFRMMLHAFYLRVPTRAERVEACTPDPFLPTLDACWSPHTLLQPLDQLAQALQAAPDPEPTDRAPRSCSPSGPLPGPGRPPPPPETEAQRASCLQWLSEWSLEPGH